MTTDRPTATLHDTDGSHLTDLPLAAGIQYQTEVSAPGSLTLRLPIDDSATALATADRILKVSWRGKARQAARIGTSSRDVAVDGRIWRQWSSVPGLLSVFGRVLVYPEYGLDRASNQTRRYGYMSRTGHGDWLGTGNWTPAVGVRWSDMTGVRRGVHDGAWSYPNPKWIAKDDPTLDQPAGTVQFFRRRFTTDAKQNVQILATADNFIDLWLDGEQLIDSAGQRAYTWRTVFQTLTSLPAGLHVIAARVRNARDPASGNNPMGLLFTMQRTDSKGEPILETPLVNSDEEWFVSDTTPGFHRAEVLDRLWVEGSTYGYRACDLLPLDFTRTVDSDGVAWTDTPGEYGVDVDASLLDVVSALTEKDLDVCVDAQTLKVQAWNRLGSNKAGTVQLQLGRDAGNLVSHNVERTEPGVNTVVYQLADERWEQRQVAAAVTARGREGGGLSLGSTSDTRTANQTADAQLLDSARASIAFTSQVSTLDGPQLYTDWSLGDTLTVPDETGTSTYAARVLAVTVDASSDDAVKVTPEFMLDRSATPLAPSTGGDGTIDLGDLEDPTGTGV